MFSNFLKTYFQDKLKTIYAKLFNSVSHIIHQNHVSKSKLIVLLVLLVTMVNLGQNLEWAHFAFSLNRVFSLESSGEFLWVGTESGIVRININTNETKNFSYSNLPSAWIISIAVDKKGNLWFGTGGDGLLQYTSNGFRIYNKINSQIPDNHISDISFDSKDNLWVGTWDGIAKFDGKDWTVFKTTNSNLPDHEINSIAVDNNDVIWIGTASMGVARFDGKKWLTYNNTNNSTIQNNYIRTIKIDKLGNKFIILAYNGIVKYNDTTWTCYQVPNSVRDIRYLNFDSNNEMWLATWGGLVKFDGLHFTIYDKSNSSIMRNEITLTVLDSYGNVWVGDDYLPSESIHLQKFNGINWSTFTINSNSDAITDAPITSIAVDSNNVKWIANNKRIIKCEDGILTAYDNKNTGLTDDVGINMVIVDKHNNKWFTTGNGLLKYDGIKWSLYKSNYDNSFVSIHIDANDHKWIVGSYHYFSSHYGMSWGYTLFEFNDTTWIDHTQNSNFQIGGTAKYLSSVFVDDNGYKWIGSNEGLYRYNGVNTVLFNKSNSNLPSNFINEIVGDENGGLLVGTNSGVVVINRDDTWTIFNKSNSGLPSDTINSITVDKLGNKWIGTSKGLVKYDGFNWKVFNTTNSGIYTGEWIYSIAVDKELNKWVGAWGDLIEYSGEKSNTLGSTILDKNFYLYQNYPNPFNSTTIISFLIKEKTHVTLKIYDILGREVTKLIDEEKPNGIYQVKINGSYMSSGVYFYQLNAGSLSETKKFLLVK